MTFLSDDEFLTCEDCGVQNETVEECLDPGALEVDGEEIEVMLCEDCYQQRCDETI
jgi:hypothetical protein